ncbi:hypothetical protein COHA_010226 [Chlorella ohadii]|uniref:Uncharacterized protein n=1 Tax=Chlorella ohadii TaxID=2649997 RepID=A0AAD5GX63_9CHLO|nr:hypothetical protein COHA_010226 [Chlorella ohadii]
MILRSLGMRQHNMATLQRLCSTQSIWTIDLAHLLAACGACVQMLTVTIGANQAYSGERFYAEHMPSDSSRVESLFRAAPASGIPVHQRSLPLADLKALVLGGSCLPLVLVDKITLGSATAAQHSSWEAGQCAGAGVGRSSGDAAHGVAGPASSGGGAAAAVAAGQDEVAPAGAAIPAAALAAIPAAGLAAIPAAALEPGEAAPQPRQEAGQAASASPQRCGVPMPPAARITSPGQHAAAAAAAGPGPAAADEAAAGPGPAAADEALPQQDAALFHSSAAESCPGSPIGYLGHYVVLVGYDARSDEFEYRDPASERARLWVPAQRLEAARKCFGTDEDLLLVEVPSGSACCSSATSGSSEGGAAAEAAAGAAGGTATAGAAGGGRQGPPEAPQQQQQQQQPGDWGTAGASPRMVYG